MNEMVDAINGIQNGDNIVVSVPLIEGSPLVVKGHAEVDASGNVTIRANSTTIPGIPVVGEVDVSNIALTIHRGDAITGDTFSASLSADAYASVGLFSKSISINNASLTVDLANNTLTVSNAPVINYVVGSIDLNDTYDISGGESAFSVRNETAEAEGRTTRSELDSPSASSGFSSFTGFNPVQAKADIDIFVQQATGAGASMCSAYADLYSQLEENWCSQNAKIFGDAVAQETTNLFNEYKTCIKGVYANAVSAYNNVASVNGVPTIAEDGNASISSLESSMDSLSGMKLKEANNQGAVGMNINNVRETKDAFISASNDAMAKLDEISAGIALYDDDSAQQEAFRTTVKELSAKFKVLNDAITKAIDTQVSEAATGTQQAATQASETLSA